MRPVVYVLEIFRLDHPSFPLEKMSTKGQSCTLRYPHFLVLYRSLLLDIVTDISIIYSTPQSQGWQRFTPAFDWSLAIHFTFILQFLSKKSKSIFFISLQHRPRYFVTQEKPSPKIKLNR